MIALEFKQNIFTQLKDLNRKINSPKYKFHKRLNLFSQNSKSSKNSASPLFVVKIDNVDNQRWQGKIASSSIQSTLTFIFMFSSKIYNHIFVSLNNNLTMRNPITLIIVFNENFLTLQQIHSHVWSAKLILDD